MMSCLMINQKILAPNFRSYSFNKEEWISFWNIYLLYSLIQRMGWRVDSCQTWRQAQAKFDQSCHSNFWIQILPDWYLSLYRRVHSQVNESQLFHYLQVLEVLLFVPLRIAQPICLGFLIYYLASDDTTVSTQQACLCATAVVLTSALILVMNHVRLFISQHIGIRIRIATSSILYRKVYHVEWMFQISYKK